METTQSYPVVLSIAGSDSSGGAGIQADLKTFSALGVYGTTAITAITAQNTMGVHSQLAITPKMVYDQIIAVVEDVNPSFAKIGMLSNTDIVIAVAEALRKHPIPLIFDPVIVSTSGHRLLSVEAQEAVKTHILPLSTLITPNIPELMALTNVACSTFDEKALAARILLSHGAKAVLAKGGHEEGNTKSDILFSMLNDDLQHAVFSSETINTQNTHGTGCTLSAAITAFLARGLCLETAIAEAKKFTTEAIKAGADISIGNGHGPVNHSFNPMKMLILEQK